MVETIEVKIDAKQLGGISKTSTIYVHIEMVHLWFKATDKLNYYAIVIMLDFSNAFDLIKNHLLPEKFHMYGLPSRIVRWMATFLFDRKQIGNEYSLSGHSNGEYHKELCLDLNVSVFT